MNTTDKKSAQQLIDILWQKGMQHVVISPGSRNAPMILGFTSHPKYQCYSVPDERSAGFIALGIADETKSPVALVCSSGTALLNYYPAIAEAFYRKIPLVVLSADRPAYLIDQGDGQTIRQNNVYANHILYSSVLDETDADRKNGTIINKALNLANSVSGPVHLNVPFEEPIYNIESFKGGLSQVTPLPEPPFNLSHTEIAEYVSLWNNASRILILVGQQDIDTRISEMLHHLGAHALILSETTSNLDIENSVKNIDRLIIPFSADEQKEFQPDLLISFGGNVVSKKIKGYLRSFRPTHHIHVENTENAPDTYQCLTHHAKIPVLPFFNQIIDKLDSQSSEWTKKWLNLDSKRNRHQKSFVDNAPFSDIKVMQTVRNLIPENSILHLANSTPVRYAQLFNWGKNLTFKSNRGTSGIDGIVSTAIGNAMVTSKLVFLVVGDISFFYDTNAWWHRHIPSNFRVIVVNNAGGGIFRFIDGPNTTGQLENFFETHQKNSVKHIALGFNVDYFCATNLEEFNEQFLILSKSDSAGILEVFTPQTENAGILKGYFNNLVDS